MLRTDSHKQFECTHPHLCIVPVSGNNVVSQLQNCYLQLYDFIRKTKIDKINIIKQTIFVKSHNTSDFYQQKQLCLNEISNQFEIAPPTSIVAQSPVDKWLISLEVMFYCNASSDFKLLRKTFGKTNYLLLLTREYKQLICSGLTKTINPTNIKEQSIFAFEMMENILASENMSFSDVIRQWNYIENITLDDVNQNNTSQHYQIFNDIRSQYYKKANFVHGYPAATGIGVSAGGVCIDFIAVKTNEPVRIVPIKNPVQIDAHQYTKEVLGENMTAGNQCKTSPKFERAKAVCTSKHTDIYISGTAAIKGQYSINENDISRQTSITIENIRELISPDNLIMHGIHVNQRDEKFSYLRVYAKNENDIQTIRKICSLSFPDVPVQYVVGDICRSELLVEIEGMVEY